MALVKAGGSSPSPLRCKLEEAQARRSGLSESIYRRLAEASAIYELQYVESVRRLILQVHRACLSVYPPNRRTRSQSRSGYCSGKPDCLSRILDALTLKCPDWERLPQRAMRARWPRSTPFMRRHVPTQIHVVGPIGDLGDDFYLADPLCSNNFRPQCASVFFLPRGCSCA